MANEPESLEMSQLGWITVGRGVMITDIYAVPTAIRLGHLFCQMVLIVPMLHGPLTNY